MTDHTHFDAIGVPRDEREWRNISEELADDIHKICNLRPTGGRSQDTHGPVEGYEHYTYLEWQEDGYDRMRSFYAPGIGVHQIIEHPCPQFGDKG